MSKPKLQILEEGYRLVLPGDPTKTDSKPEQSEVHDFGEVIDYQAKNGTRYICGVNIPVEDDGEESDEIEQMFDHWVYTAVPVDVDIDDRAEEPGRPATISARAQLEKILQSSEMAPRLPNETKENKGK